MINDFSNLKRISTAIEKRIEKLATINRFDLLFDTFEPLVEITEEEPEEEGYKHSYTYRISGGLKSTVTVIKLYTNTFATEDGLLGTSTSIKLVSDFPDIMEVAGHSYEHFQGRNVMLNVPITIDGYSVKEVEDNIPLRELLGTLSHIVAFLYVGTGCPYQRKYMTIDGYEDLVGSIFNLLTNHTSLGDCGYKWINHTSGSEIRFGMKVWKSEKNRETDIDRSKQKLLGIKYYTNKTKDNTYAITGNTLTMRQGWIVYKDMKHLCSLPACMYAATALLDSFFNEESVIRELREDDYEPNKEVKQKIITQKGVVADPINIGIINVNVEQNQQVFNNMLWMMQNQIAQNQIANQSIPKAMV